MAKRIHTMGDPVEVDSLGLILPHEHLFTDLRGLQVPDHARSDPSAVVNAVGPYLAEAAAARMTALVECSRVGVGRKISSISSRINKTCCTPFSMTK